MKDTENTKEEAVDKNQKKDVKEKTKTEKKKKSGSGGRVFLTVLLVVLIMSISMAGAFAYLIRINYYGLADKYRKNIENIPVVKLILPPTYDPEDPYLMPYHILVSKYNEIRMQNSELSSEVARLNSVVDELSYYKDNADSIIAENDATSKKLTEKFEEYDSKMQQYELIKAELDKGVANIDIEEFRKYYESVDAENAAKIYESIVKQEAANGKLSEFSAIYEAMDASTAAAILQRMGTSKMDLIVDILFYMKKESSSEIISAMKEDFAAKVMQRLSLRYIE